METTTTSELYAKMGEDESSSCFQTPGGAYSMQNLAITT